MSELRDRMPTDLPFAIRELLISNVIVGALSAEAALLIANHLSKQVYHA